VAAPPAPSAAPPVRIASYNVCGGYVADCQSALDLGPWAESVAQAAAEFDTDVLMLQELCRGQLSALEARMPGYRAVWTKTLTGHAGCGKWNAPPSSSGSFGLGMLVRAASVKAYEAALTPADPAQPGEPRAVQCAAAPVDGRAALVCNTHLSKDLAGQGTAEVVSRARGWAAGLPVIIGGDFNADPQDPKLDVLYRLQGGTGAFTESDESDADHFGPDCRRQVACRTGQPTTVAKAGKPPRKFDYIFADTAHFLPVEGDVRDVVRDGTSLSDHLMLRAAMAWSDDRTAPTAPVAEPGAPTVSTSTRSVAAGDFTGDNRSDLVFLGRDGSVTLRPGAAGGVGQPVTLVAGTGGGWSDAQSLTAGDFNGDGKADLRVRWKAGSVFLYPGNGNGGLGGSVHVRPAGAWSQVAETVAADVTGDGRADALTLDEGGKVTLHTGVADAGSDVRVPVPAPSETALARDAVAADLDGDGRADVVVRWSDGSVTRHAGTSTGVGQPVTLVAGTGGGWSDAQSLTAGDFNGDGKADLLVRWRAGSVFLYPGNGNGGLGGSVPVLPAGSWNDAVDILGVRATAAGSKADALVRRASGSVDLYPAGSGAAALAATGVVAAARAGEPYRIPVRSFDLRGRVASYEYTLNHRAAGPRAVAGADRSDVVVTPSSAGQHTLYVTALDLAGNRSATLTYPFVSVSANEPGRQRPTDFTGDGKADLLVRWKAGSVFLYPGNGNGGLGGSVPVLPAGSWNDAVGVVTGEFTGDTVADTLVVAEDGSAGLHPGDGHGFTGERLPVLPAGSLLGTAGITAADFTGDGVSDLVVRRTDGGVVLRPGDGRAGLGAPVQLRPAGTGGWADALDVVAGDFTGDGKADLLVRWKAGSVFLYPGNGNGGLGGSVPLLPAGSWNDVVNITAGLFTADATSDVMIRWKNGSVTAHPSNGQGFDSPLPVRPVGEWLDSASLS